MNKSTNFSGIPIITQVLKFIDKQIINRTAIQHKSDRYYKRFKTYDHLTSMVFMVISGCTSLRELSSIMLACEGKINHLGLTHFPRRSTISDANKNRSSKVFGDIYFSMQKKLMKYLPDSRRHKPAVEGLFIIDSTTISLFSEILRTSGRKPVDGKKKGGIKMHTMISAAEDVPTLINFTDATTHDHDFLKRLELKPGSIIVFDKGYNDYTQYQQWSDEGVYYVTRQKDNAVWKSLQEFDIDESIDQCVLKDERILVTNDGNSFELRRIAYWIDEQKKVYEFITNNYDLPADTIAGIYKNRWQIELLFKRLKQNFPLKYFLGDNQNAIEIQIWVSLIIHLIMLVIQNKAEKRWSFSNMMAVIKYHLMTYIDLFKFLKHPDASYELLTTKSLDQLALFSSG